MTYDMTIKQWRLCLDGPSDTDADYYRAFYFILFLSPNFYGGGDIYYDVINTGHHSRQVSRFTFPISSPQVFNCHRTFIAILAGWT